MFVFKFIRFYQDVTMVLEMGMKKGLKVFGVVALLLVVAGTLAYAKGGKDQEPIIYSWHYKISVMVDTPEGEKSGSVVREVRVEFQSRPELKDFPYHIEWKVSGEAIPIDLGKRGIVFSLIDWDSYNELYDAFPYSGQLDGKSKFPRSDYYNQALKTGMTAELKTNIPRMVMFKDINDPKSVVPVEKNKMEDVLGQGVHFKSVLIEITNDPVTEKIDSLLPWLESLKSNLDGSKITTGSSYANTIHVGHFKRRD